MCVCVSPAPTNQDAFEAKLDLLFSDATAPYGPHGTAAGMPRDVAGLIGGYAHGNEPGHHTPYLYNFAGKPWKTQALVDRVGRVQWV